MANLSTTLVQHAPNLPPPACDFTRWTEVYSEPITDILTIHWETDTQT